MAEPVEEAVVWKQKECLEAMAAANLAKASMGAVPWALDRFTQSITPCTLQDVDIRMANACTSRRMKLRGLYGRGANERNHLIAARCTESRVRLANRLAGHHEHTEYALPDIIAAVRRAGFTRRTVRYTDPIAFPLSSGYVGPQRVPRWRWLYGLVMGLDRGLTRLAKWLRLGPHLCFRMLIVAERRCQTV
jgi:hypothetical protein